ncbi:MAG: hypothetical protein ACYTEE_11235 [Planctomycetota bacterium]|jgi:hypothetical protein
MDELRAGKPMIAGKVTIVPIERNYIQSVSGEMGFWLYGFKEPFAIIIFDATGIRAYDTAAIEISVASLIQKIPNLSAILASSKQKQVWPKEFPGNSA